MDQKQQAMELWRQCFNDSEEFIRFYFERKYTPENTLLYAENGQALSVLQMLPYAMTWEDLSVTTAYISGACTLPKARNRGIMSRLLCQAFQEMYHRRISFTTLIPAETWLFRYYAGLGYTPVFDYSQQTYTPGPSPHSTQSMVKTQSEFNEPWVRKQYPYFNEEMNKRENCIQHSLEDYLAVVEEAYLSGGSLWCCQNGHTASGWALAVPETDTVHIKEFFYRTPTEKGWLLQAIHTQWPHKKLTGKVPPTGPSAQHLGMARIIDVASMLQHFALRHKDIRLTLRIDDPQLPINNGTYQIAAGKCLHFPQSADRIDHALDIPTLTQALLGYHTSQLPSPLNRLLKDVSPYMSLMMD